MTVRGGATIIAPELMASISLDLNVSIEGAHAILTGNMLHIYPNNYEIQKSTIIYDMGLMDWYEYLR